MKIAVFFNANPESGGAFQDQWNILNALKDYTKNGIGKKHKILVITANKDVAEEFKDNFEVINISIITNKIREIRSKKRREVIVREISEDLSIGSLEEKWELIKETKKRGLPDKILHKLVEWYLKAKGIDLVIYPAPMASSFKINIPYIIKIYDLGHRIIPQFPELSAFGEYERREYLHENAIKNATAIITDSEQGKNDVIKYYGKEKETIFPLKHLAPTYLKDKISKDLINKTIKKYNLPDNFFYYPAQLWPHKNHILIVKAIAILKEKGIKVHVVFSGSDKPEFGVLTDIKYFAIKHQITSQIHYIGYVSNEEVNVLYKQSKGLVMASHLGPSNIPYFEAFKLGVPVIAMDVPGIKEQVQDAAIMVDPNNPIELMRAMKKILTDKQKVKKMVTSGKKILKQWTNNDYKRQLFNTIDYVEEMIKCKQIDEMMWKIHATDIIRKVINDSIVNEPIGKPTKSLKKIK